MSIARMISLHPEVEGHVNEPLGRPVRHLMFRSTMCASCADACAAEEADTRLCSDCSAVCAEECARHDHEHCALCAEMCRQVAADCRSVTP